MPVLLSSNQTINANVAQCLKSAVHWGFNRVHNVCSGQATDVPFGALDWIMVAFVGGLIAILILMCASLLIMILRD